MQPRNPDPPHASYLATLAAAAAAAAAVSVLPTAGAATQVAAPSAAPAALVRASVVPTLVRAPGGGEAIAISITVAPQWHIYWTNPGDSGAAPSVRLELPEGWASGPLTYPRPEIFGDADERTFGYSGTVHLLVPVKRPDGWQGALEVRGELSWLACKTACVAGRSPLSASVAADAASVADAPADRAWPAALPAGSSAGIAGEGSSRTLTASIATLAESEKVRFIPDDCAGVRWGDGTGPHELRWDGERRLWTLQTPISVNPGDAPVGAPRARGLIIVGTGPKGPAYWIDTAAVAAPTLTSPEPAR